MYMGNFEKIAPVAISVFHLSEAHIESFITFIENRVESAFIDPKVIEAALVGLSMPMSTQDADARFTTYCADFFERLESAGCVNFLEDNPKKKIKLLCSRLEPPLMKREIRKCLEFDEKLQDRFCALRKVMVLEAINFQTYGTEKDTEIDGRPQVPKCGETRSEPKPTNRIRGTASTARDEKQLPVCPYPPHESKGFRNFLKD